MLRQYGGIGVRGSPPGDIAPPPEIIPVVGSGQEYGLVAVFKFSLGGNLSRVLSLAWLRGTVVERRSLTGELSLSCARPAAVH